MKQVTYTFARPLRERIAARLEHLIYRSKDALAVRRARLAARMDGHNPDEVVGVGPATVMQGDLLTDGPEFPIWFFYEPKRAARHGLQPTGAQLTAARMTA